MRPEAPNFSLFVDPTGLMVGVSKFPPVTTLGTVLAGEPVPPVAEVWVFVRGVYLGITSSPTVLVGVVWVPPRVETAAANIGVPIVTAPALRGVVAVSTSTSLVPSDPEWRTSVSATVGGVPTTCEVLAGVDNARVFKF